MLSNALNTNEVKNAAGTEVEFAYHDSEGRMREWHAVGEAPNLPHRIKIQHQESGTGVNKVRRSALRVLKTKLGVSGVPREHLWYIVGVIPVGDIADVTDVKDVAAELMSLFASTGADTTIKYDCTGNGAAALIAGES